MIEITRDLLEDHFLSVRFPTKELEQITKYLQLISVNPWAEWTYKETKWTISAFEDYTKNYKDYCIPAWNRKYEQVIHDYNIVFHGYSMRSDGSRVED